MCNAGGIMGQAAQQIYSPPAVPRDGLVAGATLSTDYLNRYGEALMLIEMAPMDPSVVDDLRSWKPVSYHDHFSHSALRCADGALAAFASLSRTQAGAFESLCGAMNRLIETVVIVLGEMGTQSDAMMVIEVATLAFRNLLARATAFINSGGDTATAEYDGGELQNVVDQLMAL